MIPSRSIAGCATRVDRCPMAWIEPSFERCFQLMECDDARLLQQWIVHWSDVMEFEIVPVVPSRDTREVVAPYLDSAPAVDRA